MLEVLGVLDSWKQRLIRHTGNAPFVPPIRLGKFVNVGPSGVETPHIGLEGRWIGEQFLHSGAVGGVVEKAGFL